MAEATAAAGTTLAGALTGKHCLIMGVQNR